MLVLVDSLNLSEDSLPHVTTCAEACALENSTIVAGDNRMQV